MDFLSGDWWWIFVIIVIVLFLKLRRGRPPAIARPKRISIIGKKLVTSLSTQTPLECLLSDGRHFGENYQEKEPPQLPHNDKCRCELKDIHQNSEDVIKAKRSKAALQKFSSDLGEINEFERRYYKYLLLSKNPDAAEEQKKGFQDLSTRVAVDSSFKELVNSHVNSHIHVENQ